jgi:hypothetical protein
VAEATLARDEAVDERPLPRLGSSLSAAERGAPVGSPARPSIYESSARGITGGQCREIYIYKKIETRRDGEEGRKVGREERRRSGELRSVHTVLIKELQNVIQLVVGPLRRLQASICTAAATLGGASAII